MSLWRQVTRGLANLRNRPAADADLRDEIGDYLDRAVAERVAQGMSRGDATRAAQLELGNTTVAREQVRDYGWENLVEALVGDVRYALRRLRLQPGFTAVSVVTLALGIGATTAIFSAIDPILLASLPYPQASQLVTISEVDDKGAWVPPAYGTFLELRARTHGVQSLAAIDRWGPSLTGAGEPERLHGQTITASFFHTLGVQPAVGRDFTQADDQVGGPSVVILSHRLAVRQFGDASEIVGRTIRLDDHPFIVVGVMPHDFVDVLAPATDIWAPMQARSNAPFNSREWGHHYRIVARLPAGVSVAALRLEERSIAAKPVAEFPRPDWASLTRPPLVRSLQEDIAQGVKPTLFAIAAAALLLLAIACVNVANLLVGRTAQRGGELAMRAALGAGRGRLARQLLTESLLLSLVGGVLGLCVGAAGVRVVLALAPAELPRADAIRLDPSAFLFALLVTSVVGLATGALPALAAARAELRDGLQGGTRRTAGRRSPARRLLVVGEMALALMLLVGAGILMRSLKKLLRVDPGFQPSGVLTMQVTNTGSAYRGDSVHARYFNAVIDAVRQVPGVAAAAAASQVPLTGDMDGYAYETPLRPHVLGDASAFRYAVTPEYFHTMGMTLLRGRLLEATDVAGAPEVVVVSESFARRVFGSADPIGQRVRFGPEVDSKRPWDIVVGVVNDVRQQSLDLSDAGAFYVPMGQWWWVDNVQSIVVRTSGNAAALAPAIRRAIWSVDANQPVQNVATMDALVASSAAQRRFALVIIESFAGAALVLAAVGLYGVIAGGVTERTREIGIRTALGATPRAVLRQVMRGGLALAAGGIVLGGLAAIVANRVLTSLLFEISPTDPLTYAGVILVLLAVAVAASWFPARRAARIDPAITLRAD